LQRHVGNGAIVEHPVAQMPAAAVSGKACAVFAATVSGKTCAVSAATVSAAMSDKACPVPAPTMFGTMPAATMLGTMPAATMPAATMAAATMAASAMAASAVAASAVPASAVPAATMAAATALRVCFECDKRHEEEQHRGHASAGRQHRPYGAAGLGTPHPRGRLSLGIPEGTKSL
jgi:hypothetical protein